MIVNGIQVKWYYSVVDAEIDATLTSEKVRCVIVTDDSIIGAGSALCSPKDTYDKDFGRKLSLTRAVKNSKLTKEVKTSIWNAYKNMTKVPRW